MPTIRPAELSEIPLLNALIRSSATALSRGHYTPTQVEALLDHVFGVDSQLLHDRSYFIVERHDRPMACGGWSARRTLFGGDQAKEGPDPLLDPATEPARIRAFFVHPDVARHGYGRLLLHHCEAAARAAGFSRAELMSTLPGEAFYRAMGYEVLEEVNHPLPGGVAVMFARMGRRLDGAPA